MVGGRVGLSIQQANNLLKTACKWSRVKFKQQAESYKFDNLKLSPHMKWLETLDSWTKWNAVLAAATVVQGHDSCYTDTAIAHLHHSKTGKQASRRLVIHA